MHIFSISDHNEVSTPKVKSIHKPTPKRKLEDGAPVQLEEKSDKSDVRKTPSPQKRAKPADNTGKSKDRTSGVICEDKDALQGDSKGSLDGTSVKQQKAQKDKPEKSKSKVLKDIDVGKSKKDSSTSAKESKERRKSSKKASNSSAPSAKSSQDPASDSINKSGSSTADTNPTEGLPAATTTKKQQTPNQGSKSSTQVVPKDSDSVKKGKKEKKEKAKYNQESPEPAKVKKPKSEKKKEKEKKDKDKDKDKPKVVEVEQKPKKKEKVQKPRSSSKQPTADGRPSTPIKVEETKDCGKKTTNEKPEVSLTPTQAAPVPAKQVIKPSVKPSVKQLDDGTTEKDVNSKEKLKPSKKSSHSCKQEKKSEESGTMHFKKIHLLDRHKKESNSQEREKENGGQSRTGITAGIDLNHSVTDQIAKRTGVKHGSEQRWEAPHPDVGPAATMAHHHGVPYSNSDTHRSFATAAESRPMPRLPHMDKSSGSEEDKTYIASSSREHNNNHHEGGDVTIAHSGDTSRPSRSSSRASEEHRPNSSSSLSNHPRMEDIRHTVSKDSDKANAASPLVFDKSKPVEPYRDPELLKKDEMLKKDSEYRRMQMLQQAAVVGARSTTSHTPVPPHTSSYPTVRTPVAPPHATGLGPPHQLLTPMPTYPPHPISPRLQLPPHLAQGPGVDRPAIGLSLIQQQQQAAALHIQQMQHVLQQQPHLLSGYPTLHNTLTRQLEMLWQQKYPTLAVPPAWMLLQYQEELLRDVSILTQRDMLDRERRERELLERDRVEREIERERMERERAAERERVERAERERAERAERERQERERQERERERQERCVTYYVLNYIPYII